MDHSRNEKIGLAGQSLLRKPRILLAPLDWGLGHATRCIPLIRSLLAAGTEVWIAAEGMQLALLKDEFPDLSFIPLKGYRVRYAKTAAGLFRRMLFQAPLILKKVREENKWLQEVVKEYGFDAIISDNRYGLYHKEIPSIFITHQLNIKSPSGKWLDRILRKKNYNYIDRFTACWVPDMPGENNLAGELSHPVKKPAIPLHYIGWLSRFAPVSESEKKGHLLVVISGPEPQRSIFENKIIQEVSHYPGTATIVRGLPGSSSILPSTSMIRFYNHLPAAELNKEMAMSEFVISRSGYSTVMDLVSLGKKSILVPTPGQTEQIYLGGYLNERKIAMTVPQNQFSLQPALEKARGFQYLLPEVDGQSLLENVVNEFLQGITILP